MSELCFCVWYYLTAAKTIAGLSVRAYFLEGNEDEKAMVLRSLSTRDYRLCQPSGLSASLTHRFPQGVPHSVIRDFGIEQVFAEEFLRIAATLPPPMEMPEDKLFFATPLFDFGTGYVPAEIGDGYIRER